MSAHPDGLPVLQSHMNDYNGLYSLYFEKAHIAATSLDIDDIRHLVPGIPLILLSLYKYSVGFYVQAGNPEKISSVEDLTDPKVVFMNREKGSARRVYLDRLLKERGISSEKSADTEMKLSLICHLHLLFLSTERMLLLEKK